MISLFVSHFLLVASLFSLFSPDHSSFLSFFETREETIISSLAPIKKDPFSLGMVVSAKSAVIIDGRSKSILFEKEAHAIRSIGSLTKLMTALVFLQNNPDLSAPATFILEDRKTGGKEIFALGDVLTVHDFFLASLIRSDNSATQALVRLSGKTSEQFVEEMNTLAQDLGMTRTFFVDPTGLSSDNRSTTHDIARLLEQATQQPVIKDAMQQSSFSTVGSLGIPYVLENTNHLLNGFLQEDPYFLIGGKTGFLPEAGYCLAVHMQKDGGKDLFIVALGSETSESRFDDIKALTVWAYQTFSWP